MNLTWIRSCRDMLGEYVSPIKVLAQSSQTLVLSRYHPSSYGLLLMCVTSNPENGLNSGWRRNFNKIYPTSISHCEYPSSKSQRVCWEIGRPKCYAQRAEFKLHEVPLYTIWIFFNPLRTQNMWLKLIMVPISMYILILTLSNFLFRLVRSSSVFGQIMWAQTSG